MSTLARLKSKVPDVVAEYFKRSSEAEQNREREARAAVLIESVVRGFLTRRRIDRLRDVVTTIQRYWRGYLGCLRAKLAKEARDKRLRQKYFDAKATTIQRFFRGYWARKYLFCFSARKQFLGMVREKNQETRAQLEQEAYRAIKAQREMAEETARTLFSDRVGQLHHLVSTSTQPGIFNSPYAMATGTVPVVAGLPMEDHLKTTFKNQAQQRLPPLKSIPKKAKGPQDVYPGEVVVDGHKMSSRITLQQALPYDTLHQAQLLEEKVHRAEMLDVHPVPFASSLREPFYPPINPQTNRNILQYEDPSDPTVGRRNESFSPAMQKVSDKLFVKMQHKQPFFDPIMNKEGY